MPMNQIHLAEWIDALPADGRYTFTRDEAEAASNASFVAVQTSLRRQKTKGRIVSPRRGFYIVVPPEHRSAGSPPASWFIDDLMRFCGCGYYVGLLSAAALHGAAHQQPMVFQVLTDKLGARLCSGEIVIDARRSRAVGKFPTSAVQTETGTMQVSTPEATALDLVRFPKAVGSWHNIATVLTELAEGLDPVQLVATAELALLPDAQRLGYMLDAINQAQLANPLSDWIDSRRTSLVPLRTDMQVAARASDNRWKVIPNEDIEPDL